MSSAKTNSRRSAVALATALTATFLTGVVGLSGLARWNAAPPTGVQAAVVQSAPSATAGSVMDE
jgi:hypothetical protein